MLQGLKTKETSPLSDKNHATPHPPSVFHQDFPSKLFFSYQQIIINISINKNNNSYQIQLTSKMDFIEIHQNILNPLISFDSILWFYSSERWYIFQKWKKHSNYKKSTMISAATTSNSVQPKWMKFCVLSRTKSNSPNFIPLWMSKCLNKRLERIRRKPRGNSIDRKRSKIEFLVLLTTPSKCPCLNRCLKITSSPLRQFLHWKPNTHPDFLEGKGLGEVHMQLEMKWGK